MAAPPVEDLGAYNPFTKAANFNKERILYWVKMGAQPTVTAHNMLAEQGIVSAPKLAVKMKKAVAPVAAPAAPAAVEKAAEVPAE